MRDKVTLMPPSPLEQKSSLASRILDAIPLSIFLVDEDVRILGLNAAAQQTLGLAPAEVLQRRGGEALHCLHSLETPAGCGGSPACRTCVIRLAVRDGLEGGTVIRRRAKLQRVSGDGRVNIELLVTVNPFPDPEQRLAILVLEDITELSLLQDLIPICCHCKRVRNDSQFWQSVDHYLSDHLGLDFTHGICPDCARSLYPELFPDPEPPAGQSPPAAPVPEQS
ncbi:MAG: PAS domain-containing protein [Thermodesulfobacteriota bacterium]